MQSGADGVLDSPGRQIMLTVRANEVTRRGCRTLSKEAAQYWTQGDRVRYAASAPFAKDRLAVDVADGYDDEDPSPREIDNQGGALRDAIEWGAAVDCRFSISLLQHRRRDDRKADVTIRCPQLWVQNRGIKWRSFCS
eukprot:m.16709 g.16709  ORF g.16709 m.16709 type:complete len:138 (+) comp5082_c0_seq2:193-606(+)